MGLASLICGGVGLLLSWLIFPGLAALVGIVLGIVAVVKLSKTQGASKVMPIIGIVLGALGVIATIVMCIFYAAFVAEISRVDHECRSKTSNESSYQQCITEYQNRISSDY